MKLTPEEKKALEEHQQKFQEIIKKYNLDDDQKATEIAKFLTSQKDHKINLNTFSALFNIPAEDARIFLTFIEKGIQYKEKHLDKK